MRLEKLHLVMVNRDERKDVVKKYGITAYPTLVFVDGEGKELDRIVGYRKLDEFVAEVQEVIDVRGRYGHYAKLLEQNPADVETRYKRIMLAKRAYGWHHIEKDGPKFLEHADKVKDATRYAAVLLALAQSLGIGGDRAQGIQLLLRYQDEFPKGADIAFAVTAPTLGEEFVDLERAHSEGALNDQEFTDLKETLLEQGRNFHPARPLGTP